MRLFRSLFISLMDTILVFESSSCNTLGSIKYALKKKAQKKTIVKTARYVKLKVFVQAAINTCIYNGLP